MSSSLLIRPNHKAVQKYYEALAAYHAHGVGHEGALRSAFQNLLAETARVHKWLLVPEQRTKVNGKTVIPDGTLRDSFNLHRGYWEAKDTQDDLNAEIKKKADKGYALTNTIFEDNRDDDPEYIVRLVGQVVRVSLETVRIVKKLPQKFVP
jgi:hypothetical protein